MAEKPTTEIKRTQRPATGSAAKKTTNVDDEVRQIKANSRRQS